MDKDNQDVKEESVPSGGIIHHLLFRSYAVYLFSVILGVIFDMFWHFDMFSNFLFDYVGISFIIVGSAVAYWAQSTSGNYKEEIAKLKNKSFFNRGPYRYLRTPTHSGLFLMAFGLALLINSLFSVIFTIAAHLVTKAHYVRKQEKILESKYGDLYGEYKRKVKNWL